VRAFNALRRKVLAFVQIRCAAAAIAREDHFPLEDTQPATADRIAGLHPFGPCCSGV
jgi:hypothetical protein